MGKTEKLRKYRQCWESENWAKGWLREADADANKIGEAFCKICRSFLRAHLTDLQRHAKTKMHCEKMKKLNPQQNNQTVLSNTIIITNEQKELDLKLSLYVATHTSIKSIDHLGEILKVIGKKNNSLLSNLKLHRTKCSTIIKNVISPSLLEELILDIGTTPFSLIVDESTDVSVIKYLCLCVKYFSTKNLCVKIEFLSIIEVDKCTAEALNNHVCNYLKDIGLDISNLVGIGTDGANNLCGKHHSLFTLLKQKSPNLQIVRCICHSLNNALSKATEQFPSNIDFLCREIYNWFHISPHRRFEYKATFDLLNSSNKKLHQFKQLSGTRWLARAYVVNSILENWLELKTHFSTVINKEKCYTARVINEMLQDNINYLFLLIIRPILNEFNHLNLTFQKNFVDIGKSYDDITSLFIFLAKKIMNDSIVTLGYDSVIENIDNDSAYQWRKLGPISGGAEAYS
ncbi:unnamed protein product [Macrosiphum euphorbiae]|uniref:DUF4371 domain-containing protein n=1 Tax=Macrosiphum euphorbiae TaxID=13131 RepID=A0AAV0WSU8_9HEMI|nr:unnamed protein product [Macrosiphum euphorbiae]